MPQDTVAPDATQSDAKANPKAEPRLTDEHILALKDLGVDPQDALAYLQDKGNWEKQQNRRLMEIAEEKNRLAEILERQTALGEEVLKRTTPATPAKQVFPVETYLRGLGLEPDDLGTAVTHQDNWRVVAHAMQTVMDRMDSALPQGVSVADILAKAEAAERKASLTYDTVSTQLVDQVRNAIATKMELAEPAVIDRAIEEAKGKGLPPAEFRDYVLGEAEKSHAHYERVAQAAREAERRRLVPEPNFTGVGEGATPSGEAPLNPWKKGDRARM